MTHFCPIPVSDRSHALGEGRTLPDPGAALAPEHAAALRSALLGGETHYTPRPGLPELQDAIAQRIEAAGAPAAGHGGHHRRPAGGALRGSRGGAGGGRQRPRQLWILSPAIQLDDPGVRAACAVLDLFAVGG